MPTLTVGSLRSWAATHAPSPDAWAQALAAQVAAEREDPDHPGWDETDIEPPVEPWFECGGEG